ncbi:MAG: hypothetical protein OEV60_02390 [Actinomycetota bacterium]|nr:hypothetical protein [Actinomycetota bacterium]MDH5223411.1 hypothetical protein [Actinomycetota bacterium]MDH5312275.1 hypothetical protein [Actinomycetota bacterium]
MKAVEIAGAVVFAGLAVRSLVHWVRTPYESSKASDLALYALFVTGRVGMWVVLTTAFVLYALTDTQGRAFIDDARQFQWLYMVFLALGALQFVAAFFLGQRAKGR